MHGIVYVDNHLLAKSLEAVGLFEIENSVGIPDTAFVAELDIACKHLGIGEKVVVKLKQVGGTAYRHTLRIRATADGHQYRQYAP